MGAERQSQQESRVKRRWEGLRKKCCKQQLHQREVPSSQRPGKVKRNQLPAVPAGLLQSRLQELSEAGGSSEWDRDPAGRRGKRRETSGQPWLESKLREGAERKQQEQSKGMAEIQGSQSPGDKTFNLGHPQVDLETCQKDTQDQWRGVLSPYDGTHPKGHREAS